MPPVPRRQAAALALAFVAVLTTATLACSDGADAEAPAPTGPSGPVAPDALDAGPAPTTDASSVDSGAPRPDAEPSGVAPPGAVPGAIDATDGPNAANLGVAEVVFRVETKPGEHAGFMLEFSPAGAAVVLAVDRWNGATPVRLGETDAGRGLRALAVVDQGGPRTFWVRARSATPVTATLKVTRTPFAEGAVCATDCARLLQLPLPNERAVDGYDTSEAVYRYQFGRRDLLMFIRDAGRRMRAAGRAPFMPEDLSQWNGETPGEDVGAPRHASHQRGKDADLSLYALDKTSTWRSFCTAVQAADGRECRAGSVRDFDGDANARFLGVFFATNRVTMMFLDRELIAPTRAGAARAVADGALDAKWLPLYSDGSHLQHWPNHDNHVHVRVSEAATTSGGVPIGVDLLPLEPP